MVFLSPRHLHLDPPLLEKLHWLPISECIKSNQPDQIIKSNQIKSIFILHHYTKHKNEFVSFILITMKYKVVCMCFSAINGSGPAYLSELLHVYTPSRTLRSSSDTRMLKIKQCKRKTHGYVFQCHKRFWFCLPL